MKINFIMLFTFDFDEKTILKNTIRLSGIISLYLREPCFFFACLIFGQNILTYVLIESLHVQFIKI